MYSNKHNFAPRFGMLRTFRRWACYARRMESFYAVDMNPACIAAHVLMCFEPSGGQLTPRSSITVDSISARGGWERPLEPTTVASRHSIPNAPTICTAVERPGGQGFGGNTSSPWLSGSARFHLQRSHLSTMRLRTGPSARRPYKTLTFSMARC